MPKTLSLLLVLLLLACAPKGGNGQGGSDAASARPHTTQTTRSAPTQTSRATTDPVSGLPVVNRSALPAQAQRTLSLILRGGPFPYSRDGIVFANREGVLPAERRGYYHEYTVPTPGADTRGARRIVCGPLPECYYTGDHYASFRRIGP